MELDLQTDVEERQVLLTAEDLLGFHIANRYRLDAVLGEGGMGIVFKSHEPKLMRDIAIKLLKPSGVQGAKRLERFQRELAIIAGLSHPNIVRVFDSGMDSRTGLHFIAMELIDGVSLDKVLKAHTVKPAMALEIIYQMCGALTEPHAHGIIHRDLKPENTVVTVMSDATIQVKILDFGIARAHSTDSGRLTTTGVVMGTPRYMAPESVQGGTIDERTDLYSIGVILYEMLSGRTPFAGTTPVATMIDHVTKPAPRLDEAVHDFAYPKIVELVRSLLEKDPAHRIDSARAVREAVDAIRDEYTFARLKINPGDTMAALLPYLLDFDGVKDEIRDQIGTYESTLPMGEEQNTDSAMIPIPAAVAREHFKEMGWSKPLPELDQTDAVAEAEEAEFLTPDLSPGPSRIAILAVGALALLGIGIWYALSGPAEPIDLRGADTAQGSSEVVAAEPEKKVAIGESIAPVEPTEPTEPASDTIAAPETDPEPVEEAPQVTKTTKSIRTKDKVEPKKVDEVKEGLEWLKQ